MTSRFNYSGIIKTALTQISKFGQPIVITYNSPGSYNPATSSVTVTTTTADTVGLPDNYKVGEIDGSLVQIDDFKLYVPAQGLATPNKDDLVTLEDGTRYTIIKVDVIAPGGSNVLFTFQCRK